MPAAPCTDRKSTRLNSSHLVISYAVFCLTKETRRRSDHQSRRSQRPGRPEPGTRERTHECAARFFFNDTATTEIYTLPLHDALPICVECARDVGEVMPGVAEAGAFY